MEPLTNAQIVFNKMRKLFPEDPDGIRAKSEMKKREEDKLRQLFIRRRNETLVSREVMAKARAAKQIKPKSVS